MSLVLRKGDAMPIARDPESGAVRVIMGLGWDPVAEPIGPVDLDGSCLLFDDARNWVDTVWFDQLRSQCGSVVHTGDNLTGEGHSDDEQILIDLSLLPDSVTSLVFVINSFSGHDFRGIDNAACRLIDVVADREIARYCLGCQGAHTGQVMTRLARGSATGDWHMHAIGEACNGRSFEDLLPTVRLHL
ncbi:MAG: TerD family protein [Nevskiales bacterium]|nr:TerD family protein [Nevskiales bacterium]